jgi:hypothetical protein
MIYMLCRNRVTDFAKWRAVFDSHNEAHQDVGIKLVHLWRSVDEPNNVFFLLGVANIDKAKEFISHPEAAKAGEASGVIDGEVHFVEDTEDY